MWTFVRALISMVFTLLGGHFAYASSGITYHGRLLTPAGAPVISSNVQFRMQIRTPGIEDCLLYEEIQNHDLSSTNGMFAISLGDGSGTRQDSNTWTLFDVLSNRKAFSFAPGDCVGVNNYTPATTDNRKFKVSFNDGTFAGWEALPVQMINFIPMSIESYAVGGFPASSLLRVETAGTLGVTTPLTSTQYAEILALVNGSSSQYEKNGELNGSALPTIGSGESVRWNGSAWQAFTPITSETDPTVEAFAKSSLPTCGANEVLKSDGTSLSCVTDAGGWSATDATTTVKGIVNVPTAGGLEVSSGSIRLPDVVTGGTFTKVTVDDKGRVTTGANITGSDITSGTIGGSTSISTTGTVSSASLSTRQIDLFDSDNTHHIGLLAPATADLTANYDLVFPSTLGSANQVLGMNAAGTALENKSITAGSGVTINHTVGGIEIEAVGSGGTVTSVTGTAPISVDNTDPSDPVISLSNVGTAGTYGSSTEVPVFTTDAKGRVTAVTETTISGVSPVGSTLSTGEVWVGDGSNDAHERFLGVEDLKTNLGVAQIPTSCTAAQTMTWSAVTDVFSCVNISIAVSQVSGLDMGDYVEVAGDTMTGALTVNGRIGAAGGMLFNQGSAATDNLIYIGSTTAGDVDASFGFFAGGVGSLSGNDGPYMIARGNAFSAIPNQRGMLNFYAGSPTTPTGNEGSINFATGTSDQTRMTISRDGSVGIGTAEPQRPLHVNGSIRLTASTTPSSPQAGDIFIDSADSNKLKYYDGSGWVSGENSAPSVVALTDSANIDLDASQGRVFEVTLGGDRTLDNPTNLINGAVYYIRIRQDASGNRDLTWGSNYSFSTKTSSTIDPRANHMTVFQFMSDGTYLYALSSFDPPGPLACGVPERPANGGLYEGCSGSILASGSMSNSDLASDAQTHCNASGVTGSCCMYHLFGAGEWYVTDGSPIANTSTECSGGNCHGGAACTMD